MEYLDICIILFYVLIVLFVGFWFWHKKDPSLTRFMGAKNSIKGWVLGCSIVVTGVSSISLLAKPGKAFASDWCSYMYTLAVPLTAIIAIRYFIPFYRKLGDCSSFSHIGKRFGTGIMIYATLLNIMATVVWTAAILYLMSITLENMTGIDGRNGVFLVGIIGIIYTSLGGIKSVIWTDVLQCFILILGVIVTLFYLINGIPGGVNGFLEVAIAHHKFSVGSLALDFSKTTFWVVLLGGIVRNIHGFGIVPETVQRYAAASSDREAKKSLIVHCILYFFFSTTFFLIGTALFVFYKTNPSLVTKAMETMSNDAIYPYFIMNTLPTGIKGLMVAAILSAGMSSIDSVLNANGMLFIENIYNPLIKKKKRLAKLVSEWQILYIIPVACGIIAILIALGFKKVENVLDEWYRLETIFSSGVLGLFLLGQFSKKAGSQSALFGLIASALVVAWMIFSPSWIGTSWESYANTLHPFTTMFIGALCVIVIGLLHRFFRKT